MLAKFARGQGFAYHLLGTIGTFAATTGHPQAQPKFTQGMRTIAYRFANLAFGNSITEANVHGALQLIKEY
jgi:hypothetical protein